MISYELIQLMVLIIKFIVLIKRNTHQKYDVSSDGGKVVLISEKLGNLFRYLLGFKILKST